MLRLRWIPGMLLAAGMVTSPARAQDHDHAGHSPYAGMENRTIKALSQEDVDGLLAGEGLGFALAAELNGLPGPKHVLELQEGLGLSPAQKGSVEEIRGRMLDDARGLGESIVQAESHLDGLFAEGAATPSEVERITGHIGEMRGRLRAVHLNAHLEVARVLTSEQVSAYARLRGYGSEPGR